MPAVTPEPPEPPEPPQPPADDLVVALAAAQNPRDQVELLLRLGRRGGGGDDAFYAVRPWLTAEDPNVRAAAYQSLGRLLERDPPRLEPHVRWAIADPNPHLRGRVGLAPAAPPRRALRPPLQQLRGDPDAHVRT